MKKKNNVAFSVLFIMLFCSNFVVVFDYLLLVLLTFFDAILLFLSIFLQKQIAAKDKFFYVLDIKNSKWERVFKMFVKVAKSVKNNFCFTLGLKILLLAFRCQDWIGIWCAMCVDIGMVLVVVICLIFDYIVKKITK